MEQLVILSRTVCHPQRTGSPRTGLRPWGEEAKDLLFPANTGEVQL